MSARREVKEESTTEKRERRELIVFLLVQLPSILIPTALLGGLVCLINPTIQIIGAILGVILGSWTAVTFGDLLGGWVNGCKDGRRSFRGMRSHAKLSARLERQQS